MIKVYGYSKCSTVQKGLKYLAGEGVEYQHIDNVVVKLDENEIRVLHVRSKLPLKRFFNTSGQKYRELGIKDIYDNLSDDQRYELLASDGMLVKRPILVTSKGVYPGFKPEKWDEIL